MEKDSHKTLGEYVGLSFLQINKPSLINFQILFFISQLHSFLLSFLISQTEIHFFRKVIPYSNQGALHLRLHFKNNV